MKVLTKSLLIYVGGVISGALLLFVVSALVVSSTRYDDYCMFETPQPGRGVSEFSIMQVFSDGNALAREGGNIVLFLAEEGVAYYDNQKIHVPEGKQVMYIGTYRYLTRENMEKTVPIVGFLDK